MDLTASSTGAGVPTEFIQHSEPVGHITLGKPVENETIHALLERMRSGDRHAAAELITRYGSRIRRRIRGKLGPTIRRLFDSQEILSTVGRRLDMYVMAGKVEAVEEAQLWAMIFKMADNALIDKARVFRRLQTIEAEDGAFAREFLKRLEEADVEDSHGVEIEIDIALRSLGDAVDRRILSLWLSGEPHTQIAQEVSLAPTAVRKRWEKIKHHLRERFAAGAF